VYLAVEETTSSLDALYRTYIEEPAKAPEASG